MQAGFGPQATVAFHCPKLSLGGLDPVPQVPCLPHTPALPVPRKPGSLPLLPRAYFCDPNHQPEGEKSEHSSSWGGRSRSAETETEEGQAPWGNSREIFVRWGWSFCDIWSQQKHSWPCACVYASSCVSVRACVCVRACERVCARAHAQKSCLTSLGLICAPAKGLFLLPKQCV